MGSEMRIALAAQGLLCPLQASRRPLAGVGIDIVDLHDFREVLARRGERFVARLFTEDEQIDCLGTDDAARAFAACFATKEATFKALGAGWSGAIRWTDVAPASASTLSRAFREPSATCSVTLTGAAARAAATLGFEGDAGTSHVSVYTSTSAVVALVVLGR